jgi:YD repeat-containing protein
MKSLFISFALLVMFASCQKEIDTTEDVSTAPVDTPAATVPNKFLVKKSIDKRTNSEVVYNYQYDAKDRLVSRTSPSGDLRYVYQYSTNSVTMDLFEKNVLTLHDIYFLNSNGGTDSVVHYTTKDTTSEKNFWNASNVISQVKEYSITNGKSVLTNTIVTESVDGDIVKETSTYNYQIVYEFSALLYTLNNGLAFLGRNKHIIKTATYTGSVNEVLNYTYTFDNLNRIIGQTVKNKRGETIVDSIYSY